MSKEMNRNVLHSNLLKTMVEINPNQDISKILLKIETCEEKGKHLNAYDEIMHLNVLNVNKINKMTFTIDQALDSLTLLISAYNMPLVPIWINVEHLCNRDNISIYKLICSRRYRKPSLLRNQETDHPPFKAIIK
ncbi:MAG: hypothetical protein NC247_06335 [Ruminococcus flavefaciens]|nr:hypothetical protein [Ruminococcus flavefaciens]